ncbi:PepSY domain-containing protein [Rhodoblastus sp. 17X3]|uniref:PepSY domain-containing protein n=1 Tax=Rhodoblastus sp. 17X3 TaxID=3047026 RepID=UPI0024B70107|nr:PepSY domain-containing protein [Rhodoblastus sp. 17X3]MDI9848796.1 PepSY domain-containing protein [Rhodoblastus sp. 17X3]
MSWPRPALIALAVLLAAASPARADESRSDQDEAREAVERGAIRPLEEILAKLRERFPGEIVKIKLEREHGIWVYEFRLLEPQGRLREITVDAATGAVNEPGGD